MELYFNPYPGAVRNAEEGVRIVVDAADALLRLRKELQDAPLTGRFADFDVSPSDFTVIREAHGAFRIRDIFPAVRTAAEREKIKLLLIAFSKGKILSTSDINDTADWVVKKIGTSAPILEFAARNGAIALTIPTEPEWRVDRIEFEERDEFLHNLWGQKDLSRLKIHCIDALTNSYERFSARYEAMFCDGALNSAPNCSLWEGFGFFQSMDRAKERGYQVDGYLIKNVGHTKFGPLLELRCYGAGRRIFFVVMQNSISKILVGGFDQKSGGTDQNTAIQDACERIDRTGAR